MPILHRFDVRSLMLIYSGVLFLTMQSKALVYDCGTIFAFSLLFFLICNDQGGHL